ncbi:MAG: class I SAM-dependent methyltransferase [Thermoguttaceae bacterium]
MSSHNVQLVSLGPETTCHLCGAAGLTEFADFRSFRRITSDCRPWPAGGRLCACPSCGSVQKLADEVWKAEVEELYAGYAIYDQAEGAEQAVFDPSSGEASSRSQRLLTALRNAIGLRAGGRMLDIGCGNGAMLRAFRKAAPGWSMAGTELSDKYRRSIETIPGVESLYTCPPAEVPGQFDMVTMIHVLEHIPEPGAFLYRLWPKLVPGGLLVVELPHHLANPFELLIADHCTHFAAATAAVLLERSGLEVLSVAENWVPKELTLVARRPVSASHDTHPGIVQDCLDCVGQRIGWLGQISDMARKLASQREVGLFGTSIAGTWLFAELEGAVGFFVDEDPHRVGKRWQGRPVYHPQQIPRGSCVLIPLPFSLAEGISRRIARPDLEICLPPVMANIPETPVNGEMRDK